MANECPRHQIVLWITFNTFCPTFQNNIQKNKLLKPLMVGCQAYQHSWDWVKHSSLGRGEGGGQLERNTNLPGFMLHPGSNFCGMNWGNRRSRNHRKKKKKKSEVCCWNISHFKTTGDWRLAVCRSTGLCSSSIALRLRWST